MKLTTSQIEQLYQFTSQHYVKWYDLQSELVDHLANAIEKQIRENPILSFEQALKIEFSKFGVFGFMDVVEERQKFLGKKYRRLIWKYYKDFFKIPKIFGIFLSIYAVTIFMGYFHNPKDVFMSIYFLILTITFAFYFRAKQILNQKEKKTGKKWLFEQNVFGIHSPPVFIHVFNVVNFLNIRIANWHFEYTIIAATVLVLITIYFFIEIKIVPKKVAEELSRTYPDYSIVT